MHLPTNRLFAQYRADFSPELHPLCMCIFDKNVFGQNI
jgi:hypothetical protein